MRILLLNPPAEHTAREYVDPANPNDHGLLDTADFGLFPPLGLLYILAALRKSEPKHELFFLDCIAEKISHVELAKRVAEIEPDLVGITSFTIAMYDVCLAARTVRAIFPSAHICLGGHHPIAFPYEAAALPEFDSIVIGEGEEAFPALAEAVAKRADFTGIRGVYTAASIRSPRVGLLEDNRFLNRRMPPPAYIKDLDQILPPDRSFIRNINYRSIVGASDRLATMISSRGCPCSCTFCDVPYKVYRQRLVQSIANEIKSCLDMGYDEVHFYDDLFNITPERVIAFSDEIVRRGFRFTWDFRGRVNTVTLDSLKRAKAAGCRMISFGVETGSDEGLLLLKKNCTVAQIRQVFQWCRSVGILTIADFMIGLPFEKSAVDVRRNIDFMLEIDPDFAQVSILSLFPNTELFADAAKLGLIRPERWQEFARNPVPDFHLDHWEQWLNMSELLRLQKNSYQRFYLRPRYIWRSLLATCSRHEFAAKVQGAMKLFR
ncbi:putative methyltransferase [Geobacter sp. OR-1]|uniref:B12-binding domain-containing radical SAM protein n=1 Tax=Geobacter sp. OR-1 TaxID=1266765 RepID=UPI000541CDB6|nr:radical SAM protein [Geobacter sp. OR-1]GAM10545.1 putative methyltransferase [Geobacter sp. OR-1]